MSRLERIRLDETAMKGIEAELEKVAPKQAVVDAGEAPAPGKAAGAKPALPAQRGLLDLGWVRAHVPIIEVADKLGMGRRGKSALCCFHDDRTPSLSFYKNRWRCHAASCGRRGNVLDLIIGILGCDVGGALSWLVQQGYTIPAVDPEARRRWKPGRAGVGGVGLDAVAKTNLLGLLPAPAALVLSTLSGLADPDSGQVEVSYFSLGRRSGVKNRTKLSDSLKILRWLELVNWRPAAVPGGFRAPSVYKLVLDLTSCGLAVEKLREAVLTVTPGGTVKNARSHPRGDARLTLGKLGPYLFAKQKTDEGLGRKRAGDRKMPNSQKGAAAAKKEEAATAPPARRRRRRIRHPGFARDRL